MTGGKSRNACRRSAAIKFIAPKGRYHNPRPRGPSNLRTLRTFGPEGRQPSRPKGRVQWRYHHPRPKGPSPPETQPSYTTRGAAAPPFFICRSAALYILRRSRHHNPRAAGAVKLKNPPAKGRSNFRTLRAQRARSLFFHKYGLCDKIT